MAEDTFYGLRNKLQVLSTIKLKNNLYRIECFQDQSTSLYLFVLFLDSGLVRFHYSADADLDIYLGNPFLEFENFIDDLVITDFQDQSEDQKKIIFKSSELIIEINSERLSICILDHARNILSEDIAQLGYWSKNSKNTKSEIRCYKKYHSLEEAPIIYGLGDKTGGINHWSKRLRSEPMDALGYDSANGDPLYKDIPFFIHLDRDKQSAHGIFFDNFSNKFYDFGKERKPSPYYYFGAESGELNYYFIAGPKIKDIIAKYLKLTGKPVLMPSFSFGYLASGMAYTENENSSEALEKFFDKAKSHDIRTKAFHLSSGYLLDDKNKRMQFIWSKKRFADPSNTFKELLKHSQAEFCANLKPVLLSEHPFYQEALDKGLFLSQAIFKFDLSDDNYPDKDFKLESTLREKQFQRKGPEALVVDYWGGPGSYMDFTKKASQDWWKSKIKENILAHGVRGIWNDNNEYEIDEDAFQVDCKKREQALWMSKLAHQASLEYKPQKRPWVLSRSGYSGIQKYAQTWTGDNASNFNALKYDTAVISSMSISGLFHTGADIGGFFGKSPDSELLTRWVQAGTFSPRFCIHSYKEKPTEAWMHAESHLESFEIIKQHMKLRDQLLPYIYQANYHAATNAEPIQRMTVIDYQDDPNTYEQSFEYIFGQSLLIAPVYEKGASTRELYLPKDQNALTNDWIDWHSLFEYKGGQSISVDLSLQTIPIFVKANSFIPMRKDDETLELKIFLAESFLDSQDELLYDFYEDDGDTNAYLDGHYLLTSFSLSKSKKLKLKIIKQEGKFTSPYTKIKIQIIINAKTKEAIYSYQDLIQGVEL